MTCSSYKDEKFTAELIKSRLSLLVDDSLSLSKAAGREWCKEYPHVRRASVAVPFSIINGAVHILLIRRSDKVWAARGDISFPGGMIEEGDVDEVDAGLRELEEELGLERDKVSLLGTLKPILGTQFTHEGQPMDLLMYLVLLLVDAEFSPVFNDEIETCWWHPLSDFADYTKMQTVLTEYRGLEMMLLSRSIQSRGSEGGSTYTIHSMPMFSSIVLAIAVHNRRETFMFGPSLPGNCSTINTVWDAFVYTTVKNIKMYDVKIGSKM